MDFGASWLAEGVFWLSNGASHGAILFFVLAATLCLPDIVLLAVFAIRRERILGCERGFLNAQPRSVDLQGRSVCVQLVLYNEEAHVEASIDCLAGLRWDHGRLEIFVVEDSTDGTTELARARVTYWREKGVDIRLLHRQERHGFKAGALANATKETTADFIAIFDADYRPEADFLEKLVPMLVENERLAYVQARLDYANRNENNLTRAQAIDLDTYYAYEQMARSWAGIPAPFNGTCGVWRRIAIEDAGGWSDRTLAEDQELSYRALAHGWSAASVATLSVPGELPSSLRALLRQRRRWSSGAAQTLRRMPAGLMTRLTLPQAALFLLLFSFNVLTGLLLCVGFSLATIALALGATEAEEAWLAAAAAVGLIVVLKSAGAILAGKSILNRTTLQLIADLIRMWSLHALLQPLNAIASLRGLFARDKLTFERTPKTGFSSNLPALQSPGESMTSMGVNETS